ncbi:uncharacterized protein LOC134817486 [Bolinopsis microptera]|uniref:uncharacterized protein LOC134817486 n=1 Tax=Bolinopsis microptera TaxID=2820187 RepID=UPI003079B271
MGQTYSTQAFSDIDSYLTSKKKVENQKLVRMTQSVTPLQNRTEIQQIQESCSTQATFLEEDQKTLNPAIPTLAKEEESNKLLEDEMTKSRLLGERVEHLEQEMWNKDAENASLKSQICKLNEMVAEEQQKTYQEQVNLYHEQVKTYNEWEEKQKEIEKNKILQEKLSKVEEELLNTKTRTTVENDTDLMDSSDSEATLVNCDVSYVPEQRICHKADDQSHMTSSISEPTEQFDFEHGIIKGNLQPIPIVPNPDDSGIDSETIIKNQCNPVKPEPEFINTDDVEREVDMMISLCNAEEEVEQLKYYLRLSQEEIYIARAQEHDLYERLQEVEQDRFRLVQRVNGLFKTNQAYEKDITVLRDLNKKFKDGLLEMQSELCETEDHNAKVFQNITTENENLKERLLDYKDMVQNLTVEKIKLSGDNKGLNNKLVAFETYCVNYQNMVQNLTMAKEKLFAETENLNKQLVEERSGFCAMELEVGYKDVVQNLTMANEKLSAETENLNKQLVEERSGFCAMEAGYKDMVQNLTVANIKLSGDNTELKNNFASLESYCAGYKYVVKNLTMDKEELSADNDSLNKQLTEAQAGFCLMQEEYKFLIDDMTTENQYLTEENQELTSEKEKLHKRLKKCQG